MEILDLKTIYEYLRDNGYILSEKGRLVLSNKFHDETEPYRQKKKVYKVVEAPKEIVPLKNTPAVIVPEVDWTLRFTNFIMAAKVPKYAEGSRGELYEVNRFSVDAMKEFRRMVEKENINEDILTKSTMLYYMPGKRFRKKIANYIIDGDWRNDYTALSTAADTGEKEVKDLIKKEIKDGTRHSPWSF